MSWPWTIYTLSDAEKVSRRKALDAYGLAAQLSILVPVALIFTSRFAIRLAKGKAESGAYAAIPQSPALKSSRETPAGNWVITSRKLRWWLQDEVRLGGVTYGQRDQWIFGAGWTLWLLFLCVHGTGRDYFHLTKRFGIVGISQMPIQYLLALKSLNPFSFIFGTSHEHVNRWHRTLGRVIYILLACHAILYLNAFVQLGVMKLRMLAPVVALGEAAFLSLSLMQTTALSSVRHASYRVFFVVHIAVAFSLPVLIFFHAGSARKYVLEAVAVLLLDLGARKLDTISSHAIVESIAGTSLVKVTAAVPHSKLSRFRAVPGGHVYLNIPGASRHVSNPLSPSYLIFELLYNPFTVASVNEQKSEVTLVARCLSGPATTALARLCKTSASSDGKGVRLNLEGPYGTLHRLSDMAREEFDRVLLVAGGVGATHIVPVYRALLRNNPSAQLEMVWAVRTPGDAIWVANSSHGSDSGILNDDNVSIYVTDSVTDSGTGPDSRLRSQSASARHLEEEVNGHAENGVEMTAIHRDRRRNRHTRSQTRRRPDLQKVVDEVFRHGSEERVAVFVCGPSSMASELREHVGVWVMKGRVVYWHAESFGW